MNVEIYLIKRHFKLQDRIGSHKTRKNKKLQSTCGVILSQWLSLYVIYICSAVCFGYHIYHRQNYIVVGISPGCKIYSQ